MTFTVLETFKSLFFSSGEKYLSDGKEEVGVPLSSNYSKHLSGDCRLSVSTENTRFSIAEIQSGCLPKDTPLVEFRRGRLKYVCLFLRDKYTDAFVQLKRVADYYNIKIEKPEYYELPFFNATLDFAPIDDSGKPFNLIEEALQYCYKKSVTIKGIDFWEKGLPYSDAPFCVQSFYLVHNYLPKFAEPYLDAKGLPIEDSESAEWWKKNTAPMNCKNGWCNAEKCAGRRFGFTGNEMPEIEFGELVQYTEEPVFYEWTVNGSTLRFDNEIDIIHQDRFLRLCMRSLGRLPRKLKNSVWLRIINKALFNMKVVGEQDTAKLNIENLNKIIIEDLKDRVLVSSYFEYERLQQSYLYLDPTTSSIVVHPSSFCSYLTGKYRDLRIDSLSEFVSVLRHLGFKSRSYKVDGNHINLMSCRSRFLFKTEEEWKEYLLDVSKDSLWSYNFKAFLLGDKEDVDTITNSEKEDIVNDAILYLDTESKGDRI